MADTFLAAFRQRDRYDLSRTDARPWLYGIATNLVGRHRRSEIRARLPAYPGTEGIRVFQQISDILTYYVPPPRVTAVLYRALALVPGARVVRDTTDVAGRHGTGFAESEGNGMTGEIMLSPSPMIFPAD